MIYLCSRLEAIPSQKTEELSVARLERSDCGGQWGRMRCLHQLTGNQLSRVCSRLQNMLPRLPTQASYQLQAALPCRSPQLQDSVRQILRPTVPSPPRRQTSTQEERACCMLLTKWGLHHPRPMRSMIYACKETQKQVEREVPAPTLP